MDQKGSKNKQGNFGVLMVILLFVIVGGFSFLWQQSLLSNIERQNEEIMSRLQQQIDLLKNKVDQQSNCQTTLSGQKNGTKN